MFLLRQGVEYFMLNFREHGSPFDSQNQPLLAICCLVNQWNELLIQLNPLNESINIGYTMKRRAIRDLNHRGNR